MNIQSSTKPMYDTLYAAFDHFNATLFEGKLPPAMLVLHRKKNAHGYFWQDMWASKKDDERLSEIALNPATMNRAPKEVLSTLVHEMVHHEQRSFGKPSKSGHNVEWCKWMERVGLSPVGVGNCEGKRSGRNFTHTVDAGGLFDVACDALLARPDVDMSLFSSAPAAKARKQDPSKVKHSCPDCDLNIWGKRGIVVICGDCNQELVPQDYV